MVENIKYTKDVVIAGKALTLSTEVSEEHLDRVYEYVRDRFESISKTNRIASQLTIGLVLGVELCDEYFIEKDKLMNKIAFLENKVITMQKESENRYNETFREIKEAHEIEIVNIKKELINRNNALENKLKQYDAILNDKEAEIENAKGEVKGVFSKNQAEIKRQKEIYEDIILEKDNEIEQLKNEHDKIISEKDLELKLLHEINDNENEVKESLEKLSEEQEKAIEKIKEEYEQKLLKTQEEVENLRNAKRPDVNNNLIQENEILRKKLEELMIIQKENFEEYTEDFYDFEEIEEIKETHEESNIIVVDEKNDTNKKNSSVKKNRKKRKGRK